MITHFLRTHLLMEPSAPRAIAVATRRKVPSIHPPLKLLSPHLFGTLAINTFARDKLIPVGADVFTQDYTFTAKMSWRLLVKMHVPLITTSCLVMKCLINFHLCWKVDKENQSERGIGKNFKLAANGLFRSFLFLDQAASGEPASPHSLLVSFLNFHILRISGTKTDFS